MLMFTATTLPTGMFEVTNYYVVAVPNADTYKVSRKKAGTAITFSGVAENVNEYLAGRFLFEQSGAEVCSDNKFINTAAPPSIGMDFIQTGLAANNGPEEAHLSVKQTFQRADGPIWRGVNTSGAATSRPIFAAYPPATNPYTDPDGWNCAVSDRGVLFSAGTSEVGRLYNSDGIMLYRRPTDATSFEIPSATRTPALVNTSGLSCAAGARTAFTFTLTNAVPNDHVIVTPSDALPDGIAIAYAHVQSANTIRVWFYNWTVAAITLSVNLQALAFRRYY